MVVEYPHYQMYQTLYCLWISPFIWTCDGSKTAADIFSVFVPVDVAVGDYVLYIYIHDLIYGTVILQICEMVARGDSEAKWGKCTIAKF